MWSEELEPFRAEARSIGDVVAEQLAGATPLETVPPQISRAMRASGEGAFPAPVVLEHAQERMIGAGDSIPARVFLPADGKINGVYFHIHGGGWVIGTRGGQDEGLDRIANQANVAAVSIEYPLAPEDPYPAGPDACETAATWLIENAASEFGTNKIVIGGESAGAHLAVVTLLRLRDKHDSATAITAANLVYGCFDLTGTPSARAWNENLILSPGNLWWFFDSYLPDRTDDERRDPDISPLYADLHGMPPALFTVGTRDPLLDDSLFMAQRWQAAGNRHELAVYPDGFHAFNAFPHAMATAANNHILEFITKTTN